MRIGKIVVTLLVFALFFGCSLDSEINNPPTVTEPEFNVASTATNFRLTPAIIVSDNQYQPDINYPQLLHSKMYFINMIIQAVKDGEVSFVYGGKQFLNKLESISVSYQASQTNNSKAINERLDKLFIPPTCETDDATIIMTLIYLTIDVLERQCDNIDLAGLGFNYWSDVEDYLSGDTFNMIIISDTSAMALKLYKLNPIGLAIKCNACRKCFLACDDWLETYDASDGIQADDKTAYEEFEKCRKKCYEGFQCRHCFD